MKTTAFRLAATISLGMSMPVQAAQSTVPCMTDAEIRGLVSYVAPTLMNRVRQECRRDLSTDGYLMQRLPDLAAELEEGKDAAWPMAKAAFLKFGKTGKSKAIDLSGLPDRFMRPLVDAAVASEVDLKLTPVVCADIEDIMEPLAPLPSASLVDVVTVALSIAARKDDKMRSCPKQP